jgi:hypothetical protein
MSEFSGEESGGDYLVCVQVFHDVGHCGEDNLGLFLRFKEDFPVNFGFSAVSGFLRRLTTDQF